MDKSKNNKTKNMANSKNILDEVSNYDALEVMKLADKLEDKIHHPDIQENNNPRKLKKKVSQFSR